MDVDDARDVALRACADAFASTRESRVDVVDVERLRGRIVAREVTKTSPLPPRATSIMDGYAYACQGESASKALIEVARARAGERTCSRAIEANECAYVTTGAGVPLGCDAVAPAEACVAGADGVVVAPMEASIRGRWIRAVGSDVRAGENLLRVGERATAFSAGVARMERDAVATFRSPYVVVVSTGDELTSEDAPTDDGSVVDTNGPMLRALCEQERASVLYSSVVRDDEDALLRAFATVILDARCDALITSGGVSMGERDYVKAVIQKLGGTIHFARLAMKPGKPMTFATIPRPEGGSPLLVFALPGNPVSAAVTFALIVGPCLRALQGDVEPGPRRVRCALAHSITLDPERPEYHRAVLSWSGSASMATATSTGKQISSRLLSMRGADVLLELPKGPGFVEAGAIVSALVISDLRHANLFAAKIDSPRTPAGKGDAIIRSGAAPNTVSVFDASSEALIDLKRAVGLEEDVRRRCREGGHISECSSTVYMYSNGESHVAFTDAGRSEVLKQAMTTSLRRLSVGSGQITKRAYARVGLVGNPSDGYRGKCIAASISNYYAEAVLTPTPGSSKIVFVPGPYDANESASFDDLAAHVERHGVDGGIRLLKSMCCNIKRYCAETDQKIDPSRPGFRLSYSSNIPKQTGLSGSSGIIISAMACVIAHYDLHIPKEDRPSLALRVEHDVGINAGPMDRVIQVHGGVVHMDFSEPRTSSSGAGLVVHGVYTHLDASKLPKLYLVWAENPSDSGKTHSTVKQRWNEGDVEVVEGMKSCARLCDEYAAALENGASMTKFKEIMDANFDLRRRMFGDSALGALNLKMIETCRSVGCGAKFTGSGGAAIAVCPDGDVQLEALKRACRANGFQVEAVQILEGSEC